jgi:hypothetical protein
MHTDRQRQTDGVILVRGLQVCKSVLQTKYITKIVI